MRNKSNKKWVIPAVIIVAIILVVVVVVLIITSNASTKKLSCEIDGMGSFVISYDDEKVINAEYFNGYDEGGADSAEDINAELEALEATPEEYLRDIGYSVSALGAGTCKLNGEEVVAPDDYYDFGF